MKKLTIVLSLILASCVITPETKEQQEARIRYKQERQLDHERLVRECYECDCCKSRYKIYNRSYKK